MASKKFAITTVCMDDFVALMFSLNNIVELDFGSYAGSYFDILFPPYWLKSTGIPSSSLKVFGNTILS